MTNQDLQIFETTAGQVREALVRHGVRDGRLITIVVEPDDLLSKARQDCRKLVIKAGLDDAQLDQLIEQAREDVQPQL